MAKVVDSMPRDQLDEIRALAILDGWYFPKYTTKEQQSEYMDPGDYLRILQAQNK